MTENRIFCGALATGIVWADRKRVVDGDYAKLAFLPYSTLDLRFEPDCPAELVADIKADYAKFVMELAEAEAWPTHP